MTNEVSNAVKDEADKAKAAALAAVNKAETGVTSAISRNAKWIALAVAVLLIAGAFYALS